MGKLLVCCLPLEKAKIVMLLRLIEANRGLFVNVEVHTAQTLLFLADRAAKLTQYDRLLASSCRPSVCPSVCITLCIVALRVGVYTIQG